MWTVPWDSEVLGMVDCLLGVVMLRLALVTVVVVVAVVKAALVVAVEGVEERDCVTVEVVVAVEMVEALFCRLLCLICEGLLCPTNGGRKLTGVRTVEVMGT